MPGSRQCPLQEQGGPLGKSLELHTQPAEPPRPALLQPGNESRCPLGQPFLDSQTLTSLHPASLSLTSAECPSPHLIHSGCPPSRETPSFPPPAPLLQRPRVTGPGPDHPRRPGTDPCSLANVTSLASFCLSGLPQYKVPFQAVGSHEANRHGWKGPAGRLAGSRPASSRSRGWYQFHQQAQPLSSCQARSLTGFSWFFLQDLDPPPKHGLFLSCLFVFLPQSTYDRETPPHPTSQAEDLAMALLGYG